jgi:hypothetical protein
VVVLVPHHRWDLTHFHFTAPDWPGHGSRASTTSRSHQTAVGRGGWDTRPSRGFAAQMDQQSGASATPGRAHEPIRSAGRRVGGHNPQGIEHTAVRGHPQNRERPTCGGMGESHLSGESFNPQSRKEGSIGAVMGGCGVVRVFDRLRIRSRFLMLLCGRVAAGRVDSAVGSARNLPH